MGSPLTEGANISTIGRRLRKRRNVYFLLGEPDIVVDISDEDASNL